LLLLLLPGIGVFLLVRMLERFSPTVHAIRFLMALGAITGFPIVCLYAVWKPGITIELAISVLALILWAKRTWPISRSGNIVLLLVHFFLWFFFCISLLGFATRPVGRWGIWDYSLFVCLILGFINALLWAKHFRMAR
jgi:hypothetical protein